MSSEQWVGPFTGLSSRAFRRLVRQVRRPGGARIADGRPGRQWALPLEDRVLLVAVYWRTNLTMRQTGHRSGSRAAAHRVIDAVGPVLALAPLRRRQNTEVAIVDGTLVPTRPVAAVPSKNYRHSANLQVAIDASTRLVLAVGRPLPGPQRQPRLHRVRYQHPARRPAGDGRRRLPGHRPDHAGPGPPRRPATARLARATQRRPPRIRARIRVVEAPWRAGRSGAADGAGRTGRVGAGSRRGQPTPVASAAAARLG
jgi:hypothetical protein